jgi:hypothetical protein
MPSKKGLTFFLEGPDARSGRRSKEKLALSWETLACSQRAAFGKQNRGKNGASMPDWKRGSGLGDRSHGGEICEVEQARPR